MMFRQSMECKRNPQQVSRADFLNDRHVELACVVATPVQLSEAVGVLWEPWEEDGLGPVQGALFRSPEGYSFSIEHLELWQDGRVLTIYGEIDLAAETIDAALVCFGLSSADLCWTRPGVTLIPHRLEREDDNGARFHIADYLCRADAELRAAELGIGGHKQFYIIEPNPSHPERLYFDPGKVGESMVVSLVV